MHDLEFQHLHVSEEDLQQIYTLAMHAHHENPPVPLGQVVAASA